MVQAHLEKENDRLIRETERGNKLLSHTFPLSNYLLRKQMLLNRMWHMQTRHLDMVHTYHGLTGAAKFKSATILLAKFKNYKDSTELDIDRNTNGTKLIKKSSFNRIIEKKMPAMFDNTT